MRLLWELGRDAGVCAFIFVQWIVVGLVVDAAAGDVNMSRTYKVTEKSDGLNARKAAALYLAISTMVVNIAMLTYSYLKINNRNETKKHPETLLGVFFEVLSSAQSWGLWFCAARTWSLDRTHPFFKDSFLQQLFDGVFEMTLVQVREEQLFL